MSIPFSINETNWQSHEKLSEIICGFNERWLAFANRDRIYDTATKEFVSVTSSTAPEYTVGVDLQKTSLFAQMQEGLHDICSLVVPYPYSGGDSLPETVYNLSYDFGLGVYEFFCKHIVGGNLWRSPSDYGFRRSTDGENFIENDGDLGFMQVGDVISAHIFDDLADFMSGFTSIYGTYRNGNLYAPFPRRSMIRYDSRGSGTGGSVSEAWNDAVANKVDEDDNIPSAGGAKVEVYGDEYFTPPEVHYLVKASTEKTPIGLAVQKVSVLPFLKSAVAYAFATANYVDEFDGFGTGLVEETWTHIFSTNFPSGSTFLGYLGDDDIEDLNLPSDIGGIPVSRTCGYSVLDLLSVVTFDFTHSNILSPYVTPTTTKPLTSSTTTTTGTGSTTGTTNTTPPFFTTPFTPPPTTTTPPPTTTTTPPITTAPPTTTTTPPTTTTTSTSTSTSTEPPPDTSESTGE